MEASSNPTKGTGWAAFAGTMVLVLGCFNLIWGLVALFDESYFAGELLMWDPSAWGFIHVVIGAVQVLTAILIFGGNEAGAVLGIMFAGFNAIAALLSIGAFPLWSVIIIVLDGLVIYALTVYGDAFKRT